MKKILLTLFFILTVSNSWAATWYIRTDGGNGTQCDGHTDHALSGATGTNCALNSPYWGLPATGQSTSKAIAGGDTLVIDGPAQGGTGSYRIGCQNSSTCADSNINLVRNGNCNEFGSFACVLGAVPSGTTANPTKIIGCSSTGCGSNTRPELWGAGNIYQIFDISGRSNITLQDMEITDHASVGEGHPTLSGGGSGNFPSRLDVRDGINIANSSVVIFKNLNIHGTWRFGMYGGSVGNHTYDNVTIAYNAKGGINYDNCNNNGTCGVTNGNYMIFKNGTTIKFNGCIENSSSIGTIMTNGCYDQNNGGYGDGIGGTNSSGNWTFTDCDISHNFSDGIDLLYFNRSGTSGGTLSIKRCRIEGNIGNQLKADNNVYVEDSFIIGNCPYWAGKPYTLSGSTICRALGATILLANNTNSGTATAKYYNNTITASGAAIIAAADADCPNTFVADFKNNIILGGTNYSGSTSHPVAFYTGEGTCTGKQTYTEDYNTCSTNFNEASPCPGSHSKNNIAASNTYSGTISQGPTYYTGDNYITELSLKSTSTAIGAANAALSGADNLDYTSADRGVVWDMGASEFTTGTSPTCGNGLVETGETCDDSNATSGDGCSSSCVIESGWSCSGTPSTCTTTCGDGIKVGAEQCDDNNTTNGDGCSSACVIENGFTCTGSTPSVCTGSSGTGHSSFISGKLKISGIGVLR